MLNLDGVVNEVLGGKTPLIYVIRDDQSSQWIRYEVRPHDTIRLIALKFRVSCKTVKKFNPDSSVSRELLIVCTKSTRFFRLLKWDHSIEIENV